jgi:hypothetical protein
MEMWFSGPADPIPYELNEKIDPFRRGSLGPAVRHGRFPEWPELESPMEEEDPRPPAGLLLGDEGPVRHHPVATDPIRRNE